MTIPTPTIESLPTPDRKKLTRLLNDRAMFGLLFSYTKLLKAVGSVDTIKACISAADEDEAKEEKTRINDGISEVLSENSITAVRGPDQFGLVRDLIYIESKGTPVINRTRAIELAPKYGLSTAKAMEWLEAATTRTPFSTVQCRKVKGKEKA